MADTVNAALRPYAQLRGTTDVTPDDLLEIILPPWTRVYTVEAPTGGSNLKVARVGTDGAAIGAAEYVDVVAGAGPREFIASEGRQAAEYTSIFIASLAISAPYVVEAEAAGR